MSKGAANMTEEDWGRVPEPVPCDVYWDEQVGHQSVFGCCPECRCKFAVSGGKEYLESGLAGHLCRGCFKLLRLRVGDKPTVSVPEWGLRG